MCDCNGLTIGTGSNGENAVYTGYSKPWLYDNTAVTAGPPAKYFRFNNVTYSSITTIYLNVTDRDSVDVTTWINSLNNSGVYGSLRLYKEFDSTIYVDFLVTAVAADKTYLTVTYVGGNGSFTGGDSIIFTFAPKGATGSAGSNGSNGSNGTNGTNGTNGLYGGFSLPWKFESSTSAGATSGYLRLNNSTYSSVSTIYVSTTNSDSVASSAFLTALYNNGIYGYLKIAKKTDGTKFWMGQITGYTTPGAYYAFTVSYIFANSTFTAEDELFLTFTPGVNLANAFLYIGKLPSITKDTTHGNLSYGTILIPGTTGGDTTTLVDTLSAFDTTTGLWTCPSTGYYDVSFSINATNGGSDMGTGFIMSGLNDASGANGRAYNMITLATNIKEARLNNAATYVPITAGQQLGLRVLNRSSNDIVGNANGAGGDSGQLFGISIKKVG